MTADLETPAALIDFFDAIASKARVLGGSDMDELTVVEGYFWLIEFADMLLEVFAHRDPVHPVVMPIVSPFRRFMGDHSLAKWNYVAELNPQSEYRLRCRPGNATFLSITVQAGGGLPLLPTAAVLGKLNNRELSYEPDGTVVVWLGGEERPGNWIPLGDRSAGLLTREFFYAPPGMRSEAVWHIENLTGGDPQRPTDAHLAASLRTALETLADAASRYPLPVGRALFAQAGVNQFAELTHFTESNMPTWGNLDAYHTTMPYDLQPDEAIVIDGGPAVPCAWWGITQNNRYVASFGRETNVNLHGGNIVVGPDSNWRALLSEHDPETQNWITTAGHRQGIVRIRWLIAEHVPPRPRATKIRLSDLHQERT